MQSAWSWWCPTGTLSRACVWRLLSNRHPGCQLKSFTQRAQLTRTNFVDNAITGRANWTKIINCWSCVVSARKDRQHSEFPLWRSKYTRLENFYVTNIARISIQYVLQNERVHSTSSFFTNWTLMSEIVDLYHKVQNCTMIRHDVSIVSAVLYSTWMNIVNTETALGMEHSWNTTLFTLWTWQIWKLALDTTTLLNARVKTHHRNNGNVMPHHGHVLYIG